MMQRGWVVVVVLLALFVAHATAAGSGMTICSADTMEAQRVDCGYFGIQQSGCEASGCCWDDSLGAGTTWCYTPQTCTAGEANRVDCGSLSITEDTCLERGCCWDESLGPGSTWCFSSDQCSFKVADRQECGYFGVSQDECMDRGCCWDPSTEGAPFCFYQAPAGYALSSVSNTDTGLTGTLQLLKETMPDLGTDIETLSLEVFYETADRLRIRITDAADDTRYEVPESVIPRPGGSIAAAQANYAVTYEENPFTITVTRVADGAVVFRSGTRLVFKDQFIQLVSEFAEAGAATYGLGESTHTQMHLESGTTYTMWATDLSSVVVGGTLYGSHPVYTQLESSGSAHGAFLLNSNGMDVSYDDDSLTFKTIGGIIDVYVFLGPTPVEVAQQYAEVVGLPAMVPYWSFGLHNTRWGYSSIYEVEDIVANYAAASIPLEAQWLDIDYMDEYRDFTWDPATFPESEVAAFVDQLHANGQRFVPIIDPAIMVYSPYSAYDEGMAHDLFIKDLQGNPYLGQVWPGPTYFPDFLHPDASAYWQDQLQAFYDGVPADGMWIDMNEVSNFCNADGNAQVCQDPGGCPNLDQQTTCCLNCWTVDGSNSLTYPPYRIQNMYGSLGGKTVDPAAKHYGNVSEYNVHNLYGLTEAIATQKAMHSISGTRSFVLSRSTFSGSGAHAAHWTGDNEANWDQLRESIIQVMNFAAVFNVPMVGADICGFIGDTTEELCARWIEVGSFYTFTRDHNTLGAAPQELYLWDSVTEAAQNALGLKYKMLPYLYTAMYHASKEGSPVLRPLWMNFPEDGNTVGIDTQFMWSDGILISPVVYQGATSVEAYFPEGLWYSMFDYTSVVDASAGGTTVTLSTPLTATNVHVRSSTIVPMQESAMTTTEARTTPFTLLVALCPETASALGDLFMDDGMQIDVFGSTAANTYITYAATATSVQGTVERADYAESDSLTLETIVMLGLDAAPASATFNSAKLSASQVTFTDGVLTVSGLKNPMSADFTLTLE